MMERWITIPSAPGYEASDAGRIRSVDRCVMRLRYGREIQVRRKGLVLRLNTSRRTGYQHVEVAGRDRLVHRLVAEAFHGPCPLGHEVAHHDGSKGNNAPSNLRYATSAENAADRDRHGKTVSGERVYGAKLSVRQVVEIRAIQGTKSQRQLAEQYGVTKSTIASIHAGRAWRGLA